MILVTSDSQKGINDMSKFLKSEKGKDGFYSNGYSDGWYSAKDGKTNSDEWFELNTEALESIAGGRGFDTYRDWDFDTYR